MTILAFSDEVAGRHARVGQRLPEKKDMKQGSFENLELAIVITNIETPDTTADSALCHAVESTILALDDAALCRLTSTAWCGGRGGLSGFDDSLRLFICPKYGLN